MAELFIICSQIMPDYYWSFEKPQFEQAKCMILGSGKNSIDIMDFGGEYQVFFNDEWYCCDSTQQLVEKLTSLGS